MSQLSGPVANRLDLDDARLLANLRAVQTRNGLPTDGQLACIEETIRTARDEETRRKRGQTSMRAITGPH